MVRRPAGLPGLTDELIARAHQWAQQSCLDQELQAKITDRAAIETLAVLLGLPSAGVRRLSAPSAEGPSGEAGCVIEVEAEVVYRRLLSPDRLSTIERRFLWRTVRADGYPTRRTLIDLDTGEILDDVWLDDGGCVRSYSAPLVNRESDDSPHGSDAPRFEAVVTPPTGADHGVVEDSRNDRALTSERQLGPSVS